MPGINDVTSTAFEGRVALVSGGGAGMGREAARGFARRGARVVVGDRDLEAAEETVHLIAQDGGEAVAQQADACIGDESAALVARAVETYGSLDAAINSAGMTGPAKTILEYTESEWDDVFAVNLRGMFLAMKHQVAQMTEQPSGGSIVNISSALGLVADGDYPAYTASKHGVIGLTRSAAIAFARQNVRINAVCPGSVRTPMWEQTARDNPMRVQEWANAHPIGRISEASEVAEVLIFLCSAEASFVTGVAMPVDGGMTIVV